MVKKKIPPFEVELVTYKKLQKIIAKQTDDADRFISVREALVTLIDDEYIRISGSMHW